MDEYKGFIEQTSLASKKPEEKKHHYESDSDDDDDDYHMSYVATDVRDNENDNDKIGSSSFIT